MSQKQIQRLFLAVAACMMAATLSCSRPSRPASQQSPAASGNNSQALNAPQQISSPQQAMAVLVPEPGAATMPAPSDAQQPDRVFASGHTSAVTAIAFSPDRRWAATGGEDKTIRIWDLANASELRVLVGHTDRVSSLAFSPDARRLASASADGTLRLWDPVSGTSLEVSNLGSGPAEQVVYSPDGRFLAASAGAADEGGHSVIEIHDGASGARIRSITVDWNNAVPLLITPDDRLFSSGGAGEDGEIEFTKVWDIRSGRELKSISLLVQAFSPDGQWGASLDYHDGPRIFLWDITSGRRVRTITAVPANISRVAFTPDGTRIAASGENGAEIKFYETATGREVQTLPLGANALAFSGDGKWLGASSGSSVKILDLSAGREIETLAGQLAAQDLIFSADGKFLITGDASLGLWDTSSGKLMRTIEGGTQSFAYSPDGRWLATNPKGNLQIWDTRTWTAAKVSPPGAEHVWWMGFSAAQSVSANLAASGVKWWQVGSGAEALSVWGATYAAALSSNGKILVTAEQRGGNVSLWDVSSGKLLRTFSAHDVGVSIVVFSPDGKWLLTAGQDSRIDPANVGASMANLKHSIKLWDTGSWQARWSLPFIGMTGGFRGFSPDGRSLAVGRANLITLYNITDGQPIRNLTGVGPGAARFSADGRWFAQGGPHGIALWNLSTPPQ
jgi:WD40 repeat protein